MEKSENRVPGQVWGPWATAAFGIVVGMVWLVIQILVVSVLVARRLASDPTLDVSQLAEDIGTNGLVLALSICATAVVCVGLILLIVRLRKGVTIPEYLALNPVSARTILGLVALASGFIILSDGLTFLLGRSVIPQFMLDAYRTRAWPALFWVALVVAGPAIEETFFRGFLFEGFRRSRLGNPGTVGLTALAWASIHLQYDLYDLTVIVVLGVFLGIVRLKTGSLWSCFFLHAFCNLVATVETALYVHGVVG